MIYGSSHEKDILHLKVRLKEKKKHGEDCWDITTARMLSVASLPASEGTTPNISAGRDAISWRAITDKTLQRNDMAFILNAAGR